MIDTILQENDLILGWTSCEKEFKQLHREIVDFNLEFLLESLGSCRKPLPERRVNVQETDNLVLKAAKLAAEYSESVIKLPLANEKIRSISDAMKDYASQIPRLVNESYAAFKQAKPDKIVAKRYALDFIEYCRIGERYGFAPWFKERKLRRAVDFVKKCEDEEKVIIERTREELLSLSAQIKQYIREGNYDALKTLGPQRIACSGIDALKKEFEDYSRAFSGGKRLAKEYFERKSAEEERIASEINKSNVTFLIDKERIDLEKKRVELEKAKVVAGQDKNIADLLGVSERESKDGYCLPDYLAGFSPKKTQFRLFGNILLGYVYDDWMERLQAINNELKSMKENQFYARDQADLDYLRAVATAITASFKCGELRDAVDGFSWKRRQVYETIKGLKKFMEASKAR